MSNDVLRLAGIISALVSMMLVAPANAADVLISLKDHKFAQEQIKVPANDVVTLTIENLDTTPAEVESKELRFEKIVKGGSRASVRIRPLPSGRYRIFDDYHEGTAETFLIVK